jgi:hypothetical protein
MQNKNTPADGRARVFEKPVAWLFGPQLIGGLKGILLYTAYGNKLDPRDWMTAKVFDNFSQHDGEEFWFDYLSDAGDGTKAMYSLAYLTLCRSLWTNTNPTAGCEVKTKPDGELSYQLPRGAFLFVGGDTAYHASDYMTLVNRMQHPFRYAFEDLVKDKLIAKDEPRRPIFGIPGNHDYYDQVDGFRRQFRKPIRPEGPLPPGRSNRHNAQLTLAGFERVQEASYVSLHLPYDWWLWGLDIEPGPITRQQLRQRCHFRSEAKPPDKLIVATSAPSTVFGQAARRDQPITTSLRFLGVSLPFFPRRDKSGKPEFQNAGDNKLKAGQCRLDLSGDVHHYARYWGPPAPGACPRKSSSAPRPSSESYASVVSGSGGAFHHPSTTYNDEICEQVLYPPEAKSRAAVADQLFKFWTVMSGGYVWLAGFIIAFALYFGATVPQSSRQFIGNIPIFKTLGLVDDQELQPTIVKTNDTQPCETVRRFWLWSSLGLVPGEWQPPEGCTAEHPTYFFPHASQWPRDLFIGQGFIWASVFAIIGTFVAISRKKIFTDQNPYKQGKDPNRKLWPILTGTTLLVSIGLATIHPYRHHITPFVSSLLVLYSLFAAVLAIVLSVRYGEYLFKKSFVSSKGGDWLLQWACWFAAIEVIACAFLFFGQNNLPAYLLSDIVFAVVLLLAIGGILALPFKVAGDLFYTKPKWVQTLGKLLIGIVHLILQLFVPYVLIRTGSYLAWLLAIVLLFLPIFAGRWLLKRNSGVGLLIAWIVYGGVMLFLPKLVGQPPVFFDWTGPWGLIPAILAGLVGAVICCLWTGWYFAVCFAFNGHNNEVGGAARIENFKQFIRFRLTRNGITGYVIAVNDVAEIGSDLKPRLIDVFHLRCK